MATFLSEVLTARDMASFDEFRDTFQIVDAKISTLKVELSRALHSCFAASDADIDRVSSWHVECVGIQEETERLQAQLDKNKMTAALSLEEINSLNDELIDCEQNIGVLKTLIEVVQNLDLAEPETDFYISSKRLKKCEEDLSTIVKDFGSDEDANWIKQVEISIADRVMENYERTMKEWTAKLRFDKNSLIVDPYRGDIVQLLEALQNLGYYKKIWEKFCNQFWQELLSKACTPDYTVEFSQPTKTQIRRRSMMFRRDDIPVRDSDPDGDAETEEQNGYPASSTLYVIRLRRLEVPLSSADAVFQNVLKLIGNMSEIFGERTEAMAEFAEMLGPQMIHVLSNKCLKTLILQQSNGDNEKATNDVACLKLFREKLWEFNFRIPDESLLDEFEENFDRLFMNQFRQNRLGEIRKLIRDDIHQTILLIPDTDDDFLGSPSGDDIGIGMLHKNPFARQKYTISKSIAAMVDILKEHARTYPDDGMLIANALNLFVSIVVVPKHESEAKDFIPLSSVLIHNNCWFLEHHVNVSFPNNEDKIPLLRAKATQAHTFMIKSIRTKLNNMIAAAMTGLNEDAQSRKSNIAGKFLEISAEFHRLNAVFFEVSPPAVLSQTLALLLDHTVNDMCSKVLSWEDISANSANELATCFVKFAEATSTLFKKNATSPREIDAFTSKVVHKWQRFRLLTFVLTASMRDIGDKWVNGCGPLAVAFTAEEIRKLVRALFQNTDHRAAFLSSIK